MIPLPPHTSLASEQTYLASNEFPDFALPTIPIVDLPSSIKFESKIKLLNIISHNDNILDNFSYIN